MRIEKVRDRERRNKKKSIGRKINQHEIGRHNYYYYFCSLCPTRRPRMMTTDDGKLFFVLQYADNNQPGPITVGLHIRRATDKKSFPRGTYHQKEGHVQCARSNSHQGSCMSINDPGFDSDRARYEESRLQLNPFCCARTALSVLQQSSFSDRCV